MTASRRLSPAVLLALLVGFLVVRAASFAVTTASEYALYLDYATAARDTSLAELYRTRDIEYPPLATLFGVAALHVADALPEDAGRLTLWRPEAIYNPVTSRYEVALGLVLFAVDVACLLLVYLIARRVYPDDGPWKRVARLGVYFAATTAMGLILYDRQDLVVGFVAVLALAAFARGWSLAAYAVLAAGIAYKLVPVMLVPFFVLAFAAARGRPFLRHVVRESLVAGLVLALVPVLMYVFCGGERAFAFLSFHSTRGLQLESSTAWFVLLADPATTVGHAFGSYNLRGALADRVAGFTTFATVAIAGLSLLLAARGFWRASASPMRNELVAHLAASSLLVWLGFILSTKVGSPQYLLWLAPLMPLLPLRGADRWWSALVVVGMVVTSIIYPGQYALVKGEPTSELTWSGPTTVGLVMLTAKSLLLTAAYVWLAVMVWRARWVTQ